MGPFDEANLSVSPLNGVVEGDHILQIKVSSAHVGVVRRLARSPCVRNRSPVTRGLESKAVSHHSVHVFRLRFFTPLLLSRGVIVLKLVD